MNAQANAQLDAMPGLPLESRAAAPTISEPRRLFWSIRRELWESRSIYIAPLAAAALVLVGLTIGAIRLLHHMRSAPALDPLQHALIIAQLRGAIDYPYMFTALLLMATTFIVAIFYCLDALHGERSDRSILFWKSLPVSDLTTVLSKASIPLLVLPLIAFVVTIVTQSITLLINAAFLLVAGMNLSPLTHLPLFQIELMLLYHLVTIHILWYAPIYGWLLLVSAWARRATFLWATLPPLAVALVEKLAFNTSYFVEMLKDRFSGAPVGATLSMNSVSINGTPMGTLAQLTPLQFLASPGLWIGLAVAAAFIAAAVQLRRYRGAL